MAADGLRGETRNDRAERSRARAAGEIVAEVARTRAAGALDAVEAPPAALRGFRARWGYAGAAAPHADVRRVDARVSVAAVTSRREIDALARKAAFALVERAR